MVLRPTAVLELHGAPVVSLHAGKLTSGAVSEHGDAWTWGCGKGGKLGQGGTEACGAPHRVRTPRNCSGMPLLIVCRGSEPSRCTLALE